MMDVINNVIANLGAEPPLVQFYWLAGPAAGAFVAFFFAIRTQLQFKASGVRGSSFIYVGFYTMIGVIALILQALLLCLFFGHQPA